MAAQVWLDCLVSCHRLDVENDIFAWFHITSSQWELRLKNKAKLYMHAPAMAFLLDIFVTRPIVLNQISRVHKLIGNIDQLLLVKLLCTCMLDYLHTLQN